jgi:hypothetical protein
MNKIILGYIRLFSYLYYYLNKKMNNKILNLFDLLPKEIIDIIYEFNVDHHTYMKNIIQEINIRNYCIFCNKKINNLIHILPSRRHLCNNNCYRNFFRKKK